MQFYRQGSEEPDYLSKLAMMSQFAIPYLVYCRFSPVWQDCLCQLNTPGCKAIVGLLYVRIQMYWHFNFMNLLLTQSKSYLPLLDFFHCKNLQFYSAH